MAEADGSLQSSRDGRRVLIVDDNPAVLSTLAMLVRIWKYEVRTAPDGPTALQLAETFQPHVILLDIGLPAMDGYEVARKLRERFGAQRPAIVALTGYGLEELSRRSDEGDFYGYLLKPVDPDDLEKMLGSVAAKRG